MPRLHPDDLKELGEMVSANISTKLESLLGRKETLSKATTLSVDEVAKILGIHKTTVVNHINLGILKATKPGKHWIITQKALNDYTDGK